jgi:hypothetical protein
MSGSTAGPLKVAAERPKTDSERSDRNHGHRHLRRIEDTHPGRISRVRNVVTPLRSGNAGSSFRKEPVHPQREQEDSKSECQWGESSGEKVRMTHAPVGRTHKPLDRGHRTPTRKGADVSLVDL